jgi:GxxExxY protein
MEKEDLTHRIIGCAYNVYKILGFGFLESVYQKALLIELKDGGLKVEAETPLKVHYRGEIVGSFYVDILVEDEIIVELKSVEHLIKAHEVQLVNYLVTMKKDIGLLVNFSPEGVKVKRKYRKKLRQD